MYAQEIHQALSISFLGKEDDSVVVILPATFPTGRSKFVGEFFFATGQSGFFLPLNSIFEPFQTTYRHGRAISVNLLPYSRKPLNAADK